MRRPLGERPEANSSPAAVSDGSLFLPKRATRLNGAEQTSCGSSRSSYCRFPPVRTIGSPAPCANFSGEAKLIVDPLTVTTVAVSWFDVLPIRTVSRAFRSIRAPRHDARVSIARPVVIAAFGGRWK